MSVLYTMLTVGAYLVLGTGLVTLYAAMVIAGRADERASRMPLPIREERKRICSGRENRN